MQRITPRPHLKATREFPRFAVLALFYLLLGIAALTAESELITPAYLEALRRGDATELRRHLDLGAEVNARDARGNTSLMLATVC
jgi:hypothetical protein